ncbi:carbohydrate ABC transporter permease [Paenibacillus glycanilyticus]|uniref:carbohydrate ABC transporter permease n=1 Tax=Paenibacillus glycanilyticus TaxID=126569 RepID=UPI000FDC51B2|nr:carbohydrate ABC transporter permease [Paenibacillus glycanilyticus]
MRIKKKLDWFLVINNIFLLLVAAACVLPMIHILAISLSSSAIASTGTVTFWPKEFSLTSYEFVAQRKAFWDSMLVSLQRIALGGAINVVLATTIAYPLSKEKKDFSFRAFYAWTFFITMIFGAGLIPTYMLVKELGLIDTVWALILPGAVPVFSVIVLLNFFRLTPKELSESAFIDGAGHWRTLWSIYVPVSMPAIATILLFSLVGHWNSWFDGLIYMNNQSNYPLQSYMQTVVVQKSFTTLTPEEAKVMAKISDKTLKSAQIFLGALPIICAYPFLQKYFVKGMVLGSVKG